MADQPQNGIPTSALVSQSPRILSPCGPFSTPSDHGTPAFHSAPDLPAYPVLSLTSIHVSSPNQEQRYPSPHPTTVTPSTPSHYHSAASDPAPPPIHDLPSHTSRAHGQCESASAPTSLAPSRTDSGYVPSVKHCSSTRSPNAPKGSTATSLAHSCSIDPERLSAFLKTHERLGFEPGSAPNQQRHRFTKPLLDFATSSRSVQLQRGSRQQLIDSVLPNLRDLAVSSGSGTPPATTTGLGKRMRHGVLFRSARPFGNSTEMLVKVLYEQLDIRCVIDLRDDDLSSAPGEQLSRSLVGSLYGLQPSIPTGSNAVTIPRVDLAPSAVVHGSSRRRAAATSFLLKPSYLSSQVRAVKSWGIRQIRDTFGNSPSSNTKPSLHRSITCNIPSVPRTAPPSLETNLTSNTKRTGSQGSSTPSTVPQEAIAPAPHRAGLPPSALAFNRQLRKLYVVNVLDTPAVKAKILETVTGSYTLPLFAVYRLTDKLTGTALAPYYFCKYFVSALGDIVDTYMEMLKTLCNICEKSLNYAEHPHSGSNFAKILKLIVLVETPILFHCTLGKDRTGLVAMLLLAVLHASDDQIAHDYAQTQYAGEKFRQFAYDFVVKKSGLPEKFVESSEDICYRTLTLIRETWQTVNGYLDSIGFTEEWRRRLRTKFLIPDPEDGILFPAAPLTINTPALSPEISMTSSTPLNPDKPQRMESCVTAEHLQSSPSASTTA